MSKPVRRRLSAAVTAGALSAAVVSTLFGATTVHAAAPAAQAPSQSPSQVKLPSAVTTLAPAATQPTSTSYTVKSGDTLSAIAARHGVTLASVFTANNMGMSTIIYPGQKITISTAPAPAAPAATTVKAAATTHIVKSGDTLSRIAAQYGVSLSGVLTANKMDLRTIIYPGQSIKLGSAAKTVTAPAAATPAASSAKTTLMTAGTYVVRAGDTLSAIAKRHGVTLSSVLTANNMTLKTVIHPGQSIKIGGAATTPTAASTTGTPSVSELKTLVAAKARAMGVDPALALAFAMQESSFRQNVTSSAGAIGTMQVMPTSGEWASQLVGRQLNLRNTDDNITAGVAIISALMKTSPTLEIAIASYYQGQYSVMNRGMYEDTKDYVASVLKHRLSFL